MREEAFRASAGRRARVEPERLAAFDGFETDVPADFGVGLVFDFADDDEVFDVFDGRFDPDVRVAAGTASPLSGHGSDEQPDRARLFAGTIDHLCGVPDPKCPTGTLATS